MRQPARRFTNRPTPRLGAVLLLGIGCLLGADAVGQPPPPPDSAAPAAARPAPAASDLETTRGFSGVGVNTIDDLRSLILEGPRDQVEAMLRVVEQIDRLSLGADPDIRVVELKAADSEAMAVFLNRVYESRTTAKVGAATTGGKVGFIPIASPNAVVVVAPPVDLEEAVEFVRQVDGERGKAASYFRVFRLETAPAAQVQAKLTQFFGQREDGAGLRLRVEVVADERTNSVLVYAGPADLAQAAALIKQLDADENGATSDLRIFPLQNAVATELALLLQQAVVNRGLSASGTPGVGGTTGGQQPQQQQPQGAGNFGQNRGGGAAAQNTPPTKSARLRLLTTDADGQAVESGILEDISVTADERSNSLIVHRAAAQHEPHGGTDRPLRRPAQPRQRLESLFAALQRRRHAGGDPAGRFFGNDAGDDRRFPRPESGSRRRGARFGPRLPARRNGGGTRPRARHLRHRPAHQQHHRHRQPQRLARRRSDHPAPRQQFGAGT